MIYLSSRIGDLVNFRNKPLQDVFNERYKANHNKELQKEAQNNRRNLIK